MDLQVFSQLPGEAGVFQTVRMMIGMVNRSFLDPIIRERGASLSIGCERSQRCEDREILHYVRSQVQYIKDPSGVEALTNPVTLEAKIRQRVSAFGDCDDMSMLIAALLKSIGHQPKFVVIGRRNILHHVLVSCHMILDATLLPGQSLLPRPQRIIAFPI